MNKNQRRKQHTQHDRMVNDVHEIINDYLGKKKFPQT